MPIEWVNTITAAPAGDGTVIACGPQSHVTGNFIVAAIFYRDWSFTVPISDTDVTDTAGNLYTSIAGASDGGGGENNVWMMWAPNAVGHPSNVVTVAFTDVVSFRRMIVVEYINVQVGSPTDAQTGGIATAATFVERIGGVTTAFANEIIVSAAVATTPATWSPMAGATLRATVGGDCAFQDQNVGAAGNYPCSMTTNVPVDSGLAIASFRYSASPYDHGARRRGIDTGSR